jgi:hypothetical protein
MVKTVSHGGGISMAIAPEATRATLVTTRDCLNRTLEALEATQVINLVELLEDRAAANHLREVLPEEVEDRRIPTTPTGTMEETDTAEDILADHLTPMADETAIKARDRGPQWRSSWTRS